MVLDPIQEIILRELIGDDTYRYIYSKTDVSHGFVPRIDSFFQHVQSKILQKSNQVIEVKLLKKKWYSMRKKFVEYNLKKAEGNLLNATQQEFYNHLIFLEECISHKEVNVYKTINRKEIENFYYDLMMGNTHEQPRENFDLMQIGNSTSTSTTNLDLMPIRDFNSTMPRNLPTSDLDLQPKLHLNLISNKSLNHSPTKNFNVNFIGNLVSKSNNNLDLKYCYEDSETEDLEYIADFQEEVLKNVSKKVKTNTDVLVTPLIEATNNNQWLQSMETISDLKNREEKNVGMLRSKNEKFKTIEKKRIVDEAINIFVTFLSTITDKKIKLQFFNFILHNIENFLKNINQ